MSSDRSPDLSELLQTLWNSCEEGWQFTQTGGLQGWNPTGEGADGFLEMQRLVEQVAGRMNILFTEYSGQILENEETAEA